jgi:hypothetical protein
MCGDVGNGPTGAYSDGGFDGRFCSKFELQFHGLVAEEALAMSAKLGSHGGKDIAKVMAITNGNTKRDRSNR